MPRTGRDDLSADFAVKHDSDVRVTPILGNGVGAVSRVKNEQDLSQVRHLLFLLRTKHARKHLVYYKSAACPHALSSESTQTPCTPHSLSQTYSSHEFSTIHVLTSPTVSHSKKIALFTSMRNSLDIFSASTRESKESTPRSAKISSSLSSATSTPTS